MLQDTFAKTLLNQGIVTADQLHIAVLEQQKQNRLLSEILIDLHFISEQVMGELLSNHSGYPYIDIQKVIIEVNLIEYFACPYV